MGHQIQSREQIAKDGARAARDRIPADQNPNPDGSQAHEIWAEAHADHTPLIAAA